MSKKIVFNGSEYDIPTSDDYVDKTSLQYIEGLKIHKEQIGIANTDGTVDYLKHINNNFLISTSDGTNLMNIDEGLLKVSFFNKEIVFKDDFDLNNYYTKTEVDSIKTELENSISQGQGTIVSVDGSNVATWNADTKADASSVSTLNTQLQGEIQERTTLTNALNELISDEIAKNTEQDTAISNKIEKSSFVLEGTTLTITI